MRVLQINQVVRVTSTGRIVENLGKYLLSQGHESYIAYSGRPKDKSNSVLYQVSNKVDTTLHAIGTRLFDRHGLYSKAVTKKFLRWVEKIDPDIIHLHNIHGYYLNYPILFQYLKQANKPICWTFHDFWPITGHCSYFTDVQCQKWMDQCNNCPKIKFYPKSLGWDNSKTNHLIKKRVFTDLDRLNIIAISKWSGQLIKKSFLKDALIHQIPNGIDSSTFKPKHENIDFLREKYSLGEKKILIALATTWGARKGYHDYLKLSSKIPSKYLIVLVGLSGDMAKDLPENIKPINRTDDLEDLVGLYNLSEINLNLSYQETFGMTTVEALMCGLPSIVYNATASPELVNDETGIVVNPGDVDGVVLAIKLIENNGGKKSYLKKCRNYALNKFDEQLVYSKHLSLYESLL